MLGFVTLSVAQEVDQYDEVENSQGRVEIKIDGNSVSNGIDNSDNGDICGVVRSSFESQLKDAEALLKKMEEDVEVYEGDIVKLQVDLNASKKRKAEVDLELQGKNEKLLKSEKSLKEAEERLKIHDACLEQLEADKIALAGVKDEATMLRESSKQCNSELQKISSGLEEEQEKNVKTEKKSIIIETNLKQCQAKLDSAETTLITHRQEKEKEGGRAAELEKSLKECHSDLVESESNFNNELNVKEGLEKTLERVKIEKEKVIEQTKKKKEKSDEELEKRGLLLKSAQDRAREMQTKLRQIEKEMRKLHIESSELYCNVTMMKEDVRKTVKTMNRKVLEHGKSFYKEIEPHIQKVQDKAIDKSSQVVDRVRPHISAGTDKVGELYHTHMLPHLNDMSEKYEIHGKPLISPLYEKVWIPVWIRMDEAVESIRLTLVSALEVWSAKEKKKIMATIKKLGKTPKRSRDQKFAKKMNILSSKAVALSSMNENAAQIVDRIRNIIIALIITFIFRRPLKPFIFLFIRLPLSVICFFIRQVLVLPYRIIYCFFSSLRYIFVKRHIE